MNNFKSSFENNRVRKLTYISALIALSVVGASIKIYSSIALDSLPGYFAALFLGPGIGAIVASIGHILTAITSGFPFTIPVHIVVAIGMALSGYTFGWLYRKSNGIIASISAIVINGPLLALSTVPFLGWPVFYTIAGVLTIASAANVVLAYVVYKLLEKRL